MDNQLVAYLISAAALYLVIYCSLALVNPLRSVPGPLIARFTNLWYLYRLRCGRVEQDQLALHRLYGSRVIRYGPNHYSICDTEALKKIYPHFNGPAKSKWYTAWSLPGSFSLFTQPNEDVHRAWRRAYSGMYSMTSMVGYEGLADNCVEVFCQRLSEFSKASKAVDLAWWFQCYAADTVSSITYRERFGYLDAGEDVGGILKVVHTNLKYGASIGIFHYLHHSIFRAMMLLRAMGVGEGAARGELQRWNARVVAERRAARKQNRGESMSEGSGPAAVIDRFLDANEADPEVFPEGRINDGLIANIVAGSDTTAMTLCAVIYYLLKNPDSLCRLRNEVDEAVKRGEVSSPITFKQSNHLKYLQAVIQETLRIYPAVGMPLERVVPPTGLNVDGYNFPPGTVVGANAWVVHRDTSIFGSDADEFRPERWIESNKEQLSLMNRNLMAFGMGSRSCLGKNISLLEMNKLIPEIVRRFDIEFANPRLQHQDWKTNTSWFVMIKELPVKFKIRHI